MRDANGNECDMWLMVDHDGHRTLFQLVEVTNGGEACQQARELHAPTVVVDMTLPALPALDASDGGRRRLGNSRLVLLNLRTVTGAREGGFVVRRARRGELLDAASVSPGDVPWPVH